MHSTISSSLKGSFEWETGLCSSTQKVINLYGIYERSNIQTYYSNVHCSLCMP